MTDILFISNLKSKLKLIVNQNVKWINQIILMFLANRCICLCIFMVIYKWLVWFTDLDQCQWQFNTVPCLYFQTSSSWFCTWGHFWEHLWCWAASHSYEYLSEDLWCWPVLCSRPQPPQWISQHWCYLREGQISSDDETSCQAYWVYLNSAVHNILLKLAPHQPAINIVP